VGLVLAVYAGAVIAVFDPEHVIAFRADHSLFPFPETMREAVQEQVCEYLAYTPGIIHAS
jgi:hypothetical protein